MSIAKKQKQLITSDKIPSKVAWIVYRWAVPLLLISVALRQIVLVYTVGLTPWKGGGFGMFASVDKARSRLAELQPTKNEGIYRLTQEKSLSSQVVSLQQVKAQVWNFRFDPQTHRIWYEPLSSKVEVRK